VTDYFLFQMFENLIIINVFLIFMYISNISLLWKDIDNIT